MSTTARARRWTVSLLLVGLFVAAASGCGGDDAESSSDDPRTLTGDPEEVQSEGLLAPQDAKDVELGGLDRPTELDGECFRQYTVFANGKDAAGTQRYTLSFHLKGDPKDERELFDFLQEQRCGRQQGEVYERVAKAVGFVTDGSAASPIELSYLTTSGRRLFL